MTHCDTPISRVFSRLQAEGQMAFMPFVTAGDPNLATTLRLVEELARKGVDLIEVGFPYSDPIADGPVIQASYTRALQQGIKVSEIFSAFRTLQERETAFPPLVAMVSYAIILRRGPEKFLQQAKEAGFSGLIVPDLPAEESAGLAQLTRAMELDLIQLLAPTTTPERATEIVKQASGFLYCISVAGVTGERNELPEALRQQLQALRKQTKVPLAVGFGISRPAQVDALRGLADGVIVGSAIVRQVGRIATEGATNEDVVQQVSTLAAEFVATTHGTK